MSFKKITSTESKPIATPRTAVEKYEYLKIRSKKESGISALDLLKETFDLDVLL